MGVVASPFSAATYPMGWEVWLKEGSYNNLIVPAGTRIYGGFRGDESKKRQRDPSLHPSTVNVAFTQPMWNPFAESPTVIGGYSPVFDGLRIQGVDNMMVRYSQCCQPVPGDSVMGYVTRGRGVSIHRTDCPNLLGIPDLGERRVEIIWENGKNQSFLVRLVVSGTDRRGLFADVAGAVSRTSTNIKSAELTALDTGIEGTFVVEVRDLQHLNKVIEAMRRVDGILAVERKEYLSNNERGIETVA